MTETRFTWRWLLVIAVIGIFMGLAVGLASGWIIFPNIGSSSIAGLAPAAQNDYIVLVANTYVYDRDTTSAKRRLAQLQDKDIKTRLERLAKALAARKDPSAASVADLAIELGSDDTSLQVMAAALTNVEPVDSNDAEPTKEARAAPAGEEPTAKPTKSKKTKATAVPAAEATEAPAPTNKPEATDAPQPTDEPEATQATPKDTAVPEPTEAPTTAPIQAAPVTTEFIPSFPDKWWEAVKFIPAEVAPGQPYWHLRYARYCDWAPTDEFNTCPGFPGGGDGVGIWIMTVDESGNCVTGDVTDILNDGSQHPLTPDMLKQVSYAWNPYGFGCDQDYEKEMYGEGNTISVPGLPSDKITELQLCSASPPEGHPPPPCGHAHVRYFLIFQRTSR